LEELQAAALEDRIEAELALGHQARVVGELGRLISEHPLRERPRAQLMLALYRSGRQAEALEAYRSFRAYLADELGIDPGPELQRLETAILNQDPGLALHAEPTTTEASAASPGPRTDAPSATTRGTLVPLAQQTSAPRRSVRRSRCSSAN
jgi:DNA-binding SARP family transcriptional activator